MLHIALISVRREMLRPLAEGLSRDPEVFVEQIPSVEEAMTVVRTRCPHLVIVDSELPGTDSLDLVKEIVKANPMVNTAVVSTLSEAEFHEKSEGLGVLGRLPGEPDQKDGELLVQKLRGILGPVSPKNIAK